MVKNTTGGNKAKGQARKLVAAARSSTRLRMSETDDEVYVRVEKMLGNGLCHVMNLDRQRLLCHIRGKFRGRGKRDNLVIVGSWLLVGLRTWESLDARSLPNCDLLEVYGEAEKTQLMSTLISQPWQVFTNLDNTIALGSAQSAVDAIEFTDEMPELPAIIRDQPREHGKRETAATTFLHDECEICIDDI